MCCHLWKSKHWVLVGKIGRRKGWKATISFCEDVLLQEQSVERDRVRTGKSSPKGRWCYTLGICDSCKRPETGHRCGLVAHRFSVLWQKTSPALKKVNNNDMFVPQHMQQVVLAQVHHASAWAIALARELARVRALRQALLAAERPLPTSETVSTHIWIYLSSRN